MPYQNKPTKKIFYKIGEIAELLNVNVSLIRFWEKEFSILKPKKNKKGNRLFTSKDFDNLKIIYHLVKVRGYTLEGARKKLKDNKAETINNFEIISNLEKLKVF